MAAPLVAVLRENCYSKAHAMENMKAEGWPKDIELVYIVNLSLYKFNYNSEKSLYY